MNLDYQCDGVHLPLDGFEQVRHRLISSPLQE